MTLLVFIVSLCAAMALGVPVAFSLMVCGLALMWHMNMFDTQIMAQNMVTGADNFILLAIPFFLLAGELMTAGGLSRRIIDFALALVGHIKGGLGVVAILSAIILASISGSAAADTAALAAILIPMMRQAGYDVPRSAGLICSGGVIAPVIPPSMAFIIFGVAANLSISKLFLAGIVPGLLMGLSLVGAWIVMTGRSNVKPLPRMPMRERLRVAGRGAWALGMPVIILGGIRIGVVTPTEAGVVASVYALFVGMFIYKELKPSQLYGVFLRAAKTTGSIMFLVAAALVSSWLITSANIPAEIVNITEPLLDKPKLLMFVLMVIVLIVGTALDLTPTILILTPVLMPIVKAAHIDPIYFGVMFIMNNAIGLLTPPVGVVLNVTANVARIPLGKVISGVMPCRRVYTVLLVLVGLVPQLITWPARWLTG
jgi:tripartite ATP-independent transporter DctM subunit